MTLPDLATVACGFLADACENRTTRCLCQQLGRPTRRGPLDARESL